MTNKLVERIAAVDWKRGKYARQRDNKPVNLISSDRKSKVLRSNTLRSLECSIIANDPLSDSYLNGYILTKNEERYATGKNGKPINRREYLFEYTLVQYELQSVPSPSTQP